MSWFALVRKGDSGQPWLRNRWILEPVFRLGLDSGIGSELWYSRKSEEKEVRNPHDRSQPCPLYVEMLHKYSAFDQLACTYMSGTNEHIFYLHWASYSVC